MKKGGKIEIEKIENLNPNEFKFENIQLEKPYLPIVESKPMEISFDAIKKQLVNGTTDLVNSIKIKNNVLYNNKTLNFSDITITKTSEIVGINETKFETDIGNIDIDNIKIS